MSASPDFDKLREAATAAAESVHRAERKPAEPPGWMDDGPPPLDPNGAPASAEHANSAATDTAVFTLLWFAALHDYVPAEQIVKGLLLAGSLFVIYGESNSGKTFFVLDLALAIASGSPWRGRRTRRGLVIYVAGEGAASVRARVAAYRRDHPDAGGLPFAIVPQAVNFMDAVSVATLIATIRAAESEAGEKATLIIIDTFARALPGADENSAQDVGTAVAWADRVREDTGAAVGFVHHAGKDPAKGARGSSALRAATDTEILIEGVTGQRTATVTKQRDLDSGEAMPFELVSVQIGTDAEDGSPVTSCTVKHLEAAAPAAQRVYEFRGKAQRQFLRIMRTKAEAEPGRLWSLSDLRQLCREAGFVKPTARSVVDAMVASPYMQFTGAGYLFTDGEPRK